MSKNKKNNIEKYIDDKTSRFCVLYGTRPLQLTDEMIDEFSAKYDEIDFLSIYEDIESFFTPDIQKAMIEMIRDKKGLLGEIRTAVENDAVKTANTNGHIFDDNELDTFKDYLVENHILDALNLSKETIPMFMINEYYKYWIAAIKENL